MSWVERVRRGSRVEWRGQWAPERSSKWTSAAITRLRADGWLAGWLTGRVDLQQMAEVDSTIALKGKKKKKSTRRGDCQSRGLWLTLHAYFPYAIELCSSDHHTQGSTAHQSRSMCINLGQQQELQNKNNQSSDNEETLRGASRLGLAPECWTCASMPLPDPMLLFCVLQLRTKLTHGSQDKFEEDSWTHAGA